MESEVKELYLKEIKKLKEDKDINTIFLVGSSKKLDLEGEIDNISDIDLFVFKNISNSQIREIKVVEGLEFDINYFSQSGINKYIEEDEYFFIKEMSEPKVIYSKNDDYMDIVNLCRDKIKNGPKKICDDEKAYIKSDINSKLNSLYKKKDISKEEYIFLITSYLKDIISGYFKINNKWTPKDKKLFKVLELDNPKLLGLIKNVYAKYRYEDLIIVYEYVFREISLKENIKINY